MRNRLKRILSLLLCAVLLAGCASQTAQTQGRTESTETPSQKETDAEKNDAPAVPEAGGGTYADTIAWDGQYDVVVVGFGGAGAVAAVTAAQNGAKVLLVEKAPEGHEGGNTRYCGQMFVYGHEDEEATLAYYKGLAGTHEVPEEMRKVYTQNIAHMYDVVSGFFGLDPAEFVSFSSDAGIIGSMSPEYPELPGSDKISLNAAHDGVGDAYLWQQMRRLVVEQGENIDVWFESPAMHLIQEPAGQTVIGVIVERDGEEVRIQAENGVVLACGGFENNPEMVETYLGMTCSAPMGTLYNTGDGVRMAMEVGADLWHMEVYEGTGAYGKAAFMTEDGERASQLGADFQKGSLIFVGADGSRQIREDAAQRHGHIYAGGSWINPIFSERNFVVYDQAKADQLQETGAYPEQFRSQIIKADTLEALAELTGMKAEVLTETVKNYNSFAKNGVDLQLGRAAETMTALSENGPYYAYEVRPIILNTQGGPRRNENAEVLNGNGDPIPHLYSAGELGGICSFQYQGGGNVAECIIFGQIAGKNAAEPKEELPAFDGTKKTSNLRFTPGAVSDIASGGGVAVELGENEYLGTSANGMGGQVSVKVTVKDGVITAIEVVAHQETEGKGTPAIDALPAAIVAANSATVDIVSGSTITSKAIMEAGEDALSQVK